MWFKNKYLWAGILLILCIETGLAFDYDISAPEQVVIGEWFSTNVSITADEPINLSVYSYVYEGLNNIGQGWTANKKEFSLGSGEKVDFSLDDLVKYGTEEGFYSLRVRFRFGQDNITETFSVKVIGNQGFAIKETYLYIGFILLFI